MSLTTEEKLQQMLGDYYQMGSPGSPNAAILQNILGADNVLRDPESENEALLRLIYEDGQLINQEAIERCEAAQEACEQTAAAVQSHTAAVYDPTKTYAVGEYVVYDGALYVCTTAVTTAEEWDADKWTETTVGVQLERLENSKAGLPVNFTPAVYTESLSTCINPDGEVTPLINTNNNYRTTSPINVKPGEVFYISAGANFSNCFYAFYDNDNNVVEKNNYGTEGTNVWHEFKGSVEAPQGATKLVIAYNNNQTPEYGLGVGTYGSVDLTYIDDAKTRIDNILSGNFAPVWSAVSGTLESSVFIKKESGKKTDTTATYEVLTVSVKPHEVFRLSGGTYSDNYYYVFYNGPKLISGQLGTSGGNNTFENVVVEAPEGADLLLINGIANGTRAKAEKVTGYIPGARWNGKKWVVFGDSLTEENLRTTKHYFDYVAEVTGISVYNMGNSGSGYMREQDVGTAFYQRISDVPTDADVITIFGSFNDMALISDLGTATDTGTTTIGGCMNTTLDNLFDAFPLANVGIVSPSPWIYSNPTDEPNNASAYCDLLKQICENRSIPFLDLFHCSGLRPWDADFRALAYSKDEGNGVHPDETGHKIIAPRFKAFLESLLL